MLKNNDNYQKQIFFQTVYSQCLHHQLQKESWQQWSDAILCDTGFYSAHNTKTLPDPPNLVSLNSRNTIHYVPNIAPLTIDGDYKIKIQPKLPGYKNKKTNY